ncbi:MAG: ATP phosphoribosyltransferase regulatory subunit [Pseudomonadota bacterium]
MERLAAASDAFVLPTVLQPLDLFVEIAGEEFRKRLFATEGANGETLCLRPDFTIPVCLEHLNSGREGPASYHYRGKIFRKHRMIGTPEFEQAGTEWIGHGDEFGTDAAVFALAMECAAAVGLVPRTRLGDAHIFEALIEGLALPASWRERLKAAFGDQARLDAALARLTAHDTADGIAARLAPALASVEPEQARAIVDAVVELPQGATGRSAQDIAERILEQAASKGADPQAASIIARFCEIEAPVDRAVDVLGEFAGEVGVELSAALEDFARRADALAKNGIDTAALQFQARFGRRLNYYTGLVFDMVDPAAPGAEVIAGGRYDKLMALLDPARATPAVGFSVWLDRIPGGV